MKNLILAGLIIFCLLGCSLEYHDVTGVDMNEIQQEIKKISEIEYQKIGDLTPNVNPVYTNISGGKNIYYPMY